MTDQHENTLDNEAIAESPNAVSALGHLEAIESFCDSLGLTPQQMLTAFSLGLGLAALVSGATRDDMLVYGFDTQTEGTVTVCAYVDGVADVSVEA